MAKSRSIAAGAVGIAILTVTISQLTGQAQAQAVPASPTVLHEAVPTELVIAEDPQLGLKPAVLITPEVETIADPAPEPLAPMTIVAEVAGGYIVFVEDAGSVIRGSSAWPQAKLEALAGFYEQAVVAYTGDQGFGSTERWAAALGITRDNPIRVVYAGNQPDSAPARAGWVEGTAIITHYTLRTSVSTTGIQLVIHELAHIWDGAHGWALGEAILDFVDNPDGYPTAKARDEGPKEDFAESVTAVLWSGYAVNQAWSDDEPGTVDGADDTWTLDRYDYVERLFQTGL